VALFCAGFAMDLPLVRYSSESEAEYAGQYRCSDAGAGVGVGVEEVDGVSIDAPMSGPSVPLRACSFFNLSIFDNSPRKFVAGGKSAIPRCL